MPSRVLCAAALALSLCVVGCSSTPPPVVVAPPTTAVIAPDTKMGWIARLEDQRVLADGASTVPASAAAPTPLAPATSADLAQLVRDLDPGVRRRAALAIGRIKDPAGLPWLTAALTDPSADVRTAAAFALGLLGDGRAVTPLSTALHDSASSVRARAIEALGLLGDKSAVPAIFAAATGCGARMATLEPDADPPASDDIAICRLALFALVRLQNYDGIAAITLDQQSQPVSRWWPVAFALQRIGDPRAVGALRTLAAVPSVYTAGFALRGLTALKDRTALPLARSLAAGRDADVKVRIAAVRLLAQAGDEGDVKLLLGLLTDNEPQAPLGLEIIAALGSLGRPAAFDALVDLFAEPDPAVRAAALGAAARIDAERFLVIVSGLGRDRDWSVRAALASTLATLPASRVTPGLVDLAADSDPKVQNAALAALAAVKAPDLTTHLRAALESADFVVRGTAARLLGEAKPAGGVAWLQAAYTRAQKDPAYGARAAALEALAAYGGDEAIRVLESALADPEWPVRARAATLLSGLGRADRQPQRPAPIRRAPAFFESAAYLHPRYSPHALVDTPRGTIEIELDVVDAPLTSLTFIELARRGYFNGIKAHRVVPTFVVQVGDPRGDGEGGPEFTLRDELNPAPYLRGTVGMALDWADTAGSQWFIALSPQPHLDAKYTAFGRVVNGWDVLDRVTMWDAIERVRIWDGVELR